MAGAVATDVRVSVKVLRRSNSIRFHIPTRLMTMAGLEPLPDSSRLTIAPVRLPCDFQSVSVGAATPSLLIIIMRVGAGLWVQVPGDL